MDNDPSTFYRPAPGSGSIYLNALMYRELLAMHYLANQPGLDDVGRHFGRDAADLLAAVREHCRDERDGFYYSVAIYLLPIDHTA